MAPRSAQSKHSGPLRESTISLHRQRLALQRAISVCVRWAIHFAFLRQILPAASRGALRRIIKLSVTNLCTTMEFLKTAIMLKAKSSL